MTSSRQDDRMARLSHRIVPVLAIVLGIAALLAVLLVARAGSARGGAFGTGVEEPQVLFPASGAGVTVELAATPEQRQRGLMQRDSLADGRGMLFLFEQTTTSPFWMKDTRIPLSIAFIDEHGRIVDIQEMQPLDETLHYPAAPYRYALEVPQGWFARNGVQVGHQAHLPASDQPAASLTPSREGRA
jgi:uncharacterized membrane protein (UPF0127 family)